MKKLTIYLTSFLVLFAMVICFNFNYAKADEVIETETETSFEDIKGEIDAYIEDNVHNEQVKSLISLGLNGAEAVALVIIYILYRKGKSNNAENNKKDIKSILKDFTSDEFKEYGKEMIQPLYDAIDKLEKSTDTIMKVLVLMQDQTANGKIALIDFLGSKTDNEEVKKSVQLVKETVEEVKAMQEKVNDEVKGEYKELF